MTDLITQPIVQYGFVGFCAVLLGIVVWLIQRLLGVLDANNRIIAGNTEAIRAQAKMTQDLLVLNRSMHDKLLSRPCIARRERED